MMRSTVRLRLFSSALAVAVCSSLGARAYAGHDHDGEKHRSAVGNLATHVGFAEATLLTIGLNLTSTVASLLDQLSNAPTNLAGGPFPPFTDEENAFLAQIGELLTDDIRVDTNGLVFNGKSISLGGMRLVHSIREDNAMRFEATPSLLAVNMEANPPSFTMSTRQQHWWVNPITHQQAVQNRTTVFTIVRTDGQWRFKEIKLLTTQGPFAVDFAPFQSPYVR